MHWQIGAVSRQIVLCSYMRYHGEFTMKNMKRMKKKNLHVLHALHGKQKELQ